MDKHEKIRFNPRLDIILLQEVLTQEPLQANLSARTRIWESITQNVNKTLVTGMVSVRQCRERAEHLIKKFKAEEMESLKASGTEEEYSDRKRLLTDIVELMEERNLANKKKKDLQKRNDKVKEAQGLVIQENSMRALKRDAATAEIDSEVEGSDSEDTIKENILEKKPTKRVKTPNQKVEMLAYLKEKSANELKIRQQELELQKTRMEEDREQRAQMMTLLMTLVGKNQNAQSQ